jgi:NTE family protein
MARAPSKPRETRRVGLALGAGGARGLAHVGVLRTLAGAGISIDAIVGTSIGAVVGAMYAAGQLEAFERRVRDLEWHQVLRMFDPVWPRSGLVSGARAVDWLTGLIGDWRIEDLALPFASVAVDLVTGEEVLIQKGKVIDAIRASMSIPGVFVPHQSGRRQLVDGALRNPVPVSALEGFGVDVRLAVNLHAQPVREMLAGPRTGEAGPRAPLSARVAEMIDGGLAKLRGARKARVARAADVEPEPNAPNLFEILTSSMTILEHELARHRLRAEPVDLVLAPDVHGIRSLEFHKARQAIAAGVAAAEAELPKIRELVRKPRRLSSYFERKP